jgi:hypothetical protein
LLSAEVLGRRAEGEESTAGVLADLPTQGWRVFHDTRRPGRLYTD